MPRFTTRTTLALPLIALGAHALACTSSRRPADVTAKLSLPPVLEVVPRTVLDSVAGATVYQGGYGSALAVDRRSGIFYLLSDRGPNVDRPNADEKLFLDPTFTPEIGAFRVEAGRLERARRIRLRDAAGKLLTGLPNPPGRGGTGEIPIGPEGSRLAHDPTGLDPEGLVALDDGSFWVADEYGPHLVHVDREGRTLERLNPFSGERALPAVLALRRPNRGLEGLTYLPGERTLVALMQSPLDNPKKAGRKSRHVRILFFHVPTGKSRQYVYRLDDPDYMVSEIAALSARRFLVIEQDPRFPGAPGEASAQKRVYAIDLAKATDVSDAADGPTGLLVGGRTIEEMSAAELNRAGITAGSKRLVVDLLDLRFGYRHDKAEGLAVLGDGRIVIANDDDFGIDSDDRGGCVPKINPATGEVERNQVYVISPRPKRVVQATD